MAYTVKQVAEMSGVSIRTLRFYHAMGLLKPAYCGANGYRFYEEPQLLILQQILFYRELGFELKQIKTILRRADFEKIEALQSHRKVLRKELVRKRTLLKTIDKTIEHLKGKRKMKSQEIFTGFNPEVQAKHEEYLVNRYGEKIKEGIAESKARIKNWTKADWEKSSTAFNEICRDLVFALERNLPADSLDVQNLVRRHFQWLRQFWTPNRESYTGHSQMIVDSDLRKAYEAHDPQLPEYISAGIKLFAKRELA
jgi:MerR family transcriptional regulator, thiopeptide resistance regulator